MPTHVRQANFTLPEDVLEELKALVPKGEALRNELKRLKFKKALQDSFGAWKKETHPELSKGVRPFIRSIRQSTRLKRVRVR